MLSDSINKIRKIIYNYPINKLILWVGAGIDADAPTKLPLGNSLAKEMLKYACGDIIATKLLKQWDITSKNIQNITQDNINISLRLETILEGIRIFENNIKTDYSILNGLKSFKDAPPNDNHYMLAKLLHNGANIVTTNYDSCIAKAYNALYQDDNYSLQLVRQNDIFVYKSNYSSAGKVYYIHGIAQHVENIGATLSIVKNPITKEFAKLIDEWADSNSCFIYLGYSGIDSLDVNPFFRSRQHSNTSTGVYVQHSNRLNETEIINSNRNENDLITCFNASYILHYNTHQFLALITNTVIAYDKQPNYTWIENFGKYYKPYPDNFKKICVLSILYLLNLNPKTVLGNEWMDEYVNYFCKDIDDWFLGYYGFQNCIRCNEKEKAKLFSSRLQRSVLLQSDIRTVRSNCANLIKKWVLMSKIEMELKEKIKNHEVIEWEILTPINRLTKCVLFILANSFFAFYIIKIVYRGKFNKLIQMLNDIIKAGSLYVAEINQINVAYANLGLLELVVNRNKIDAKKYIDMAKNNYIEVNSISGIINTMIYEIIYNELLYFYEKKHTYKEIAIHLYNQLDKIVKSEGYVEEKRKLISAVIKIGKRVGINLKVAV